MQAVYDNEQDLTQELEDVEKRVQRLKVAAEGMEDKAVAEEVKSCQTSLKQIASLLNQQKVDINYVTKTNGQVNEQQREQLQNQYYTPFSQRHERLKQTIAEVGKLKSKNEAKAAKAKAELFGNKALQPEKSREEQEEEMVEMGNELTPAQVQATAQAISHDTTHALHRTENVLQVMHEQAGTIEVELAKQQENIELIEDEMDNLAAQVKRARREVGQFSRRLATDRCFICLFIMVLLLICTVVGIKVFHKHQGTEDRDEALLFEDDQ